MANHPMVQVTWYGAVTFCNFLSEMEGKPLAYNLSTWEMVDADLVTPGLQYVASYRLPTESEWERAAAWDGSKYWIYTFVLDTLTGNVWEWCHDWYGSYTASAKTDPIGDALGSDPVFRGGSWSNGAIERFRK